MNRSKSEVIKFIKHAKVNQKTVKSEAHLINELSSDDLIFAFEIYPDYQKMIKIKY